MRRSLVLDRGLGQGFCRGDLGGLGRGHAASWKFHDGIPMDYSMEFPTRKPEINIECGVVSWSQKD